jgi:hypothetical protein
VFLGASQPASVSSFSTCVRFFALNLHRFLPSQPASVPSRSTCSSFFLLHLHRFLRAQPTRVPSLLLHLPFTYGFADDKSRWIYHREAGMVL